VKKLIFPILICIAYASSGQTIPLDSFYVPGVKWTFAWPWWNYPRSSCNEYGYDKVIYRIANDTVISGINYHVISTGRAGDYYYPMDAICGGGFHTDSVVNYEPFGRLRVDSNKVYFTQDYSRVYSPSDNILKLGHEYLLYDFNLSHGTSISPDSMLYNGIYVNTVDSVALSNRVYVNKYLDSSANYWIYGIGSCKGFLPDLYYRLLHYGPGRSGDGPEISLCYEHPAFSYKFQYATQILYGELQNNCFDMSYLPYLIPTGNPNQKVDDMIVYPNPVTSNYMSFDYGSNSRFDIEEVAIYDITNRLLYRFTYPFRYGNSDVSAPLATGVYIIKSTSVAGRVFMKKIVRI